MWHRVLLINLDILHDFQTDFCWAVAWLHLELKLTRKGFHHAEMMDKQQFMPLSCMLQNFEVWKLTKRWEMLKKLTTPKGIKGSCWAVIPEGIKGTTCLLSLCHPYRARIEIEPLWKRSEDWKWSEGNFFLQLYAYSGQQNKMSPKVHFYLYFRFVFMENKLNFPLILRLNFLSVLAFRPI